jgi:hypothetical protein
MPRFVERKPVSGAMSLPYDQFAFRAQHIGPANWARYAGEPSALSVASRYPPPTAPSAVCPVRLPVPAADLQSLARCVDFSWDRREVRTCPHHEGLRTGAWRSSGAGVSGAGSSRSGSSGARSSGARSSGAGSSGAGISKRVRAARFGPVARACPERQHLPSRDIWVPGRLGDRKQLAPAARQARVRGTAGRLVPR